MLEKYCEKQGWELVAVYQDDGFTGLNMERPDLQRMLRALERRQINLVITKDLSRLGRNSLQDVYKRQVMVCSKSNRGRYASPALAAASYPFVDLPSGDRNRSVR